MAESRLALILETRGGEGKLRRLFGGLTDVDKAAEKARSRTDKLGKSFFSLNAAGKAAAGGVRAVGTAIKASLKEFALVVGALSGITAAVGALTQQDFAVAKVKSLGVNADQLTESLKALTRELKGSASLVDLTAASYDVASAGFKSAADITEILAAAQRGAVGGFADLNTVANATTSVLNAYGKSASEAGALVDGFIQTQNDGKIVVAQYATQIGKVAPLAAAAGISLEELNAAIAVSTASGVQVESAFAGLRQAIALIVKPSGEAAKLAEALGIELSGAALKSKGLAGVLRDIGEATNGDAEALVKLLGSVEAVSAVAPLLVGDLKKFEKALMNQANAAGVAQKANDTAADTIQGAWKRLTSSLSNLFAEQSVLGEFLKNSLKVIAIAFEQVGIGLDYLKKVWKAFMVLIQPTVDLLTKSASGFKMNWEWLDKLHWATAAASIAVKNFGISVGEMIENVIQASGPLGGLYVLMKKIKLLDLEGAGRVLSQGPGPKKRRYPTASETQLEAELRRLRGLSTELPDISGDSGGSGKTKADNTAQQLKAAQDRLFIAEREYKLAQQTSAINKIKVQYNTDVLQVKRETADAIAKSLSKEETSALLDAEKLELLTLELKYRQDITEELEKQAKAKADALRPIQEEIDLLNGKLNGDEDEIRRRQEIGALMRSNKDITLEEATALVQQRDNLKALVTEAEKLDAIFEQIGSTIKSALVDTITAAIDGSKDLQSILSDTLKQVGGLLINAGLSGIFGKGGAFGKDGLPGFADGGVMRPGQQSLVGERGPEIITPLTPTLVTPFEENRDALRSTAEDAANIAGLESAANPFAVTSESVRSANSYGGSNSNELNNAYNQNSTAMSNTSNTLTNNSYAAAMAAAFSSGGTMTVDVDSTVINNQEYVTIQQFSEGMNKTANQARAKVFSDLKNKPSRRKGLGL